MFRINACQLCVCVILGGTVPISWECVNRYTGQLNTSFHFGSVLLEERSMGLEVKSMSVDTGQNFKKRMEILLRKAGKLRQFKVRTERKAHPKAIP